MLIRTLILSLCGLGIACASLNAAEKAPATAPAPVTLTGTLEGGMMAIGGETTGWTLKQDGGDIEVDVRAVQEAAEKLQGHTVTITGHYMTKDYVERGQVKILVARQIVATKKD